MLTDTDFFANEGFVMHHVLGCAIAILVFFCVRSWAKHPLEKASSLPLATPFPFNQTVSAESMWLSLVVRRRFKGDTAAYFRHCRKRLGYLFFTGPLFSQPHACPCLVVTDPADQAAMLRKEKELEWIIATPDTVTEIEGLRNFQNMPAGPRHAALRKVYRSVLSPSALQQFTASIVDGSLALWYRLEKTGEEVEILHEIRKAQLKLMCKVLYGLIEDTEQDREILDRFSRDFVLTEKALFPMNGLRSTDFKVGIEAKERISKILNDRFDSIFEERIASKFVGNDKKERAIVAGSVMEQVADALIQLGCRGKKDKADSPLSYDDARDNLYPLLEASHFTTMHVSAAMLYLLNRSENRVCLQRLRHEARSVEPTYEGLRTFAFGTACVNETMRLAPILGSVSYYIPEGKSFELRKKPMRGPVVLQFNSSNWYEDPEVFDDPKRFMPERWLPADKEMSKFARSTFHPFGFGHHRCLGFPLAKLVLNANLYCFASKATRLIMFDEDKIKLEPARFPEKKVSHCLLGTVASE